MLNLDVSIPNKLIPTGLTPGRVSLMTRTIASKVRAAVIAATPRDRGLTARSWTPVKKGVEGSYSFSNPYIQAISLERGSQPGSRPWPSVGPRTTMDEGRIFSSQAPGGITKKAGVDSIIDINVKRYLDRLDNATG